MEAAVELQPGLRTVWGKLANLYGELDDVAGVANAMEHELKLFRLQEWQNKINKVRRVKQLLLQKKEQDDKLRYVGKHIQNISIFI